MLAMDVSITKLHGRSRMICERSDGTRDVASLGPNLPFHDLAHFVAERRLRIRNGLFGHIARGYSTVQLSTPAVIRTLAPEALMAEVVARGVGALATGACTPEQYAPLVNEELVVLGMAPIDGLGPALASAMLDELRLLAQAYAELADGASLKLCFELDDDEPSSRRE